MDSNKWFSGGGSSSSSDKAAGKKPVDLTLKLGLPDAAAADVDESPYTSNSNFPAATTFSHHQGGSPYGYVAGGGSSESAMFMGNSEGRFGNSGGAGMNSQYGRPPNSDQGRGRSTSSFNNSSWSGLMGSSHHHPHFMNQYNSAGSSSNSCSQVVGFPMGANSNVSSAAGGLAPPMINEYTLIDVPSSRKTYNFLDSDYMGGPGRQRSTGNNFDPDKKCTNFNCNTQDTPMWRRGPLGPKTLCNACGIKYRKEEEKRRAQEEAKNPKN